VRETGPGDHLGESGWRVQEDCLRLRLQVPADNQGTQQQQLGLTQRQGLRDIDFEEQDEQLNRPDIEDPRNQHLPELRLPEQHQALKD
jgi:hypothetical protein